MALPLGAQEYKIAVVGLVHSHVWGHLRTMVQGKVAKLVGVSEPNPELVAEAKKSRRSRQSFLSGLQQDAG